MHRIRHWAAQKAHGPAPLVARTRTGQLSTTDSHPQTQTSNGQNVPLGVISHDGAAVTSAPDGGAPVAVASCSSENEKSNNTPLAATEPGVTSRFFTTVKDILLSSYINVLLIFVPIGIASHFAKLSAGIVFAMNAIAIIPLAGLLSHATESVACRLGDTIGALMNVTFGNAVELIIFIIALVKDEIEIVQASLVGSILSNLLLILGMCFFLGGLRYREQIYNSTVTQMSACLLSLSVSSLLLPTAFHASFTSTTDADTKVLKVSRGTSVILLLVYLLYLVFQLNSHSYMYESTPREVVERESRPGPAAGYWNESEGSSSSSSSSSSDSDSDSDASTGTAKRIKRAIRKGRKKIHRRGSSTETATPTSPASPDAVASSSAATETMPAYTGIADDEAEAGDASSSKPRHKKKHKHRKHSKATTAAEQDDINDTNAAYAAAGIPAIASPNVGDVRRVDFALGPDVEAQPEPALRPKLFSLRSLANPSTLSKTLSVNVFNNPATAATANASGSHAADEQAAYDNAVEPATHSNSARPQNTLRRTASMPVDARSYRQQPSSLPPIVPIMVNRTPKTVVLVDGEEVANPHGEEEPEISRTTAIILLLVSTGLVALCAEFMVGSINEVVSSNSGVSEAFIGLIVLPIVGNAAEHVTAVTVAMKNKMDLALGVALGSSIQIAIFVTPVVVLLGWIMDKDMSLYFTLFETVSMFVSAFIVNFLVLDGRSNYLEGALLCAAYVIIAVAAFFYPNSDDANALGGGEDSTETARMMVVRTVASIFRR
ncbi:vacuolar calcium ion transporter [Ophiostoma piceae UAMH 11346]|uniref:Vacuolar calcium ion transporter n=1 Tax=Ophiostoma piceae (strain UAMH 11346) TaxID=1262450 RepID=S3D0T2_OPHP1|nr:vacuolar calcium ion transporter [Ophiostoma piceae UAMH 11346]